MAKPYKRWPVSGTHRLEVPRVLANKIKRVANREGFTFQSLALWFLEEGLIAAEKVEEKTGTGKGGAEGGGR